MIDRPDIKEEIENIEHLIAALSVRVSVLKDTLEVPSQNTTTSAPTTASAGGVARRVRSAARIVTGKRYTETNFLEQFRLNDRVIVTNKYKGLQGTEGYIYKLDFPWVHLKTDSGATLYRKYNNVSVIADRS